MTTHSIPHHFSTDDAYERLLEDAEKPVGEGRTRTVFRFEGREDLVIKVSRHSHQANWTEAMVYRSLDDAGRARVGIVHSISCTGKYLVMEYLRDLDADEPPDHEIPTWLTDRKIENLGRAADGNVKVRDYGEVTIETRFVRLPSKAEIESMKAIGDIVRDR